jgi:hypothetical protein
MKSFEVIVRFEDFCAYSTIFACGMIRHDVTVVL